MIKIFNKNKLKIKIYAIPISFLHKQIKSLNLLIKDHLKLYMSCLILSSLKFCYRILM